MNFTTCSPKALSCRNILKHISLVLLTAVLFVSQVSATEYELIQTEAGIPNCASDAKAQAGDLKKIVTRFDSVSNEFYWEATFQDCNGTLPNGFWLVTNNGPNPKGHAGELAIFYFDASNPADVVVTAYAYNGKNPLSYLKGDHANAVAPDRIVTSKAAGSENWLYEASLLDNNDGTRTLTLSIDGTILKNHTPVYPDNIDPWYGVGFDNYLGYWFHWHADLQTTYCDANSTDFYCTREAAGQDSDGFLLDFQYGKKSYRDTANKKTNRVPYCITKYRKKNRFGTVLSPDLQDVAQLQTNQNGCHELAVGENFYAEVLGDDAEGGDLTVNYTGQPATAVITPANGTTGPSPLTATFDWTPGIANENESYNVKFTFTDEDQADTSCELKLCVPDDKDPVCDLKMTTQNPQCGGLETIVEFDASGSSDPEQGALSYSWYTTCTDAGGNTETLQLSNGDAAASLNLSLPGLGQDVNCTVGVIVSDMFQQQTNCEVPVQVEGCELDCLDQPNGDAQLDQCGVCNGNNACLDCLDVPFGDAKVDLCGVCDGNNDCLDCLDVPFGDAELDRCGVCNGNGESCLDCGETDITQLQFQLDGLGLEQLHTLRYSTKLLRRKGTKGRNSSYIESTLLTGEDIYRANWVLTWSIPQVITQCTNAEFCVQVSNADELQTYNTNAETLYTLTKKTIRRMRRQIDKRKNSARKSRFGKKYYQRAREQYERTQAISAMVPEYASDCS